MWPSEVMIQEHRKDMMRIASQNTLAREVRGERQPLIPSLIRVFTQLRLRRPHTIEILPAAQPPRTPLRRVS
jgi:hypothetical protein